MGYLPANHLPCMEESDMTLDQFRMLTEIDAVLQTAQTAQTAREVTGRTWAV